MATAKRPSSSPARMERTRVGVESMRRETPSWRVRMSWVAAVIEVRNMKRTVWLCAPSAKVLPPLGERSRSPGVVP